MRFTDVLTRVAIHQGTQFYGWGIVLPFEVTQKAPVADFTVTDVVGIVIHMGDELTEKIVRWLPTEQFLHLSPLTTEDSNGRTLVSNKAAIVVQEGVNNYGDTITPVGILINDDFTALFDTEAEAQAAAKTCKAV